MYFRLSKSNKESQRIQEIKVSKVGWCWLSVYAVMVPCTSFPSQLKLIILVTLGRESNNIVL